MRPWRPTLHLQQSQAGHPLPVEIVQEPSNELEYLRDLTKPFWTPLGMFGVVLIFTVFLLIAQDDLRNRLLRLAGLDRLNVMTQALEDATGRVSRYLMLLLLVNSCFGILCAAGLFLIGVPYAILWGALAGILRIVPYAGSLAAAGLPLILSLAVFDTWKAPLLVFLLFAVVELVTGNILEPWLYGTHTGISSLALLLSAVFWTVLWGPAGLILSTPLTVCVVVLGRHAPQFSFLHILLGDESVLAAEAQVYQRLLAMDDQQARAVADVYLRENSLGQLYDSVFIPALSMAEQDRHKGALDKTREDFLFLSVKEMLAEFSEQALRPEPVEHGPSALAGRCNLPSGGRRGRRDLCGDVSAVTGTGGLCHAYVSARHLTATFSRPGCAGRERRVVHFGFTTFRVCPGQNSGPATQGAVSPNQADDRSMGIHRRSGESAAALRTGASRSAGNEPGGRRQVCSPRKSGDAGADASGQPGGREGVTYTFKWTAMEPKRQA